MSNKRHIDYQEVLTEDLIKNPGFAIAYLNEAAKDKDPRILKLALKNVIQARLKATKKPKKSILNHEDLPRILSRRGNPSIAGVAAILEALGIDMSFNQKPI